MRSFMVFACFVASSEEDMRPKQLSGDRTPQGKAKIYGFRKPSRFLKAGQSQLSSAARFERRKAWR